MNDGPLALGQMLDAAAARAPDTTAIVSGTRRSSMCRSSACPVLGEVVMAFVIPKAGVSLTPQEVRDFAKDQIANFKIPRHVEIVSEFPLTGSGKVQKFTQKAWAVETYGFSGPA
jgi:acyl-CoA synthetase (AMP-forming)/AMP-acid ligase II